jgi:hypothetical protein
MTNSRRRWRITHHYLASENDALFRGRGHNGNHVNVAQNLLHQGKMVEGHGDTTTQTMLG